MNETIIYKKSQFINTKSVQLSLKSAFLISCYGFKIIVFSPTIGKNDTAKLDMNSRNANTNTIHVPKT
jgi:hypothetical protein